MHRLEQLAGADYVTFTSSSTVRFLLRGDRRRRASSRAGARVVSIGPITSDTARELGLEVRRRGAAHTTSTASSQALLGDALAPVAS